jgi:integrase
MASITDKAMQGKAGPADIWLTQPFMRGAGVFVGRITPSGERLFYFRYTDSKGGRPFLPIGAYHPKGGAGFSLAAAYAKASELSAVYRSGVKDLREYLAQQEEDRARAAVAARAADEDRQRVAELEAQRRITVRQLFDLWQRAELTPSRLADGTRTGRKDGGAWVLASFERRVFPAVGQHQASEVRRSELLAILDECKAGGARRTANVLLADIRQMFRFAAEREIVPKNPLDGIKRASVGGKDVERDRVLNHAEIKALWSAVPKSGMAPRSAAAIWLILATACRVGEAMGARWEHFNLQRDAAGDVVSGTWYLPETKNERDHTIHLSRLALVQVEKLASLREKAPGDEGQSAALVPWVFPNSAKDGPVCIKSFGKQLADRQRTADKRMKNRSKCTDALVLEGGRWTAHDLRRTAATTMAGLGISTDIIDECLNHKLQSKVARVYIRDRRLTEQARAFDALGARLEQMVGQPSMPTNVVAMKAA